MSQSNFAQSPAIPAIATTVRLSKQSRPFLIRCLEVFKGERDRTTLKTDSKKEYDILFELIFNLYYSFRRDPKLAHCQFKMTVLEVSSGDSKDAFYVHVQYPDEPLYSISVTKRERK